MLTVINKKFGVYTIKRFDTRLRYCIDLDLKHQKSFSDKPIDSKFRFINCVPHFVLVCDYRVITVMKIKVSSQFYDKN